MGVAGPDWGTLIENNVAVILHGTNDSTVTGGAGGVGVPDGVATVVTNIIGQIETLSLKSDHSTWKRSEKSKRVRLTTCISCRPLAS